MKQLSLLLISFLLSTHVFAQEVTDPNKTQHNQQYNFAYFGQYKLNPQWGIHTDVQFRMDENVQFAKQSILRAGLIRYLHPNLNATTGYAYINTHAAALDDYFTEHRIWEQLVYNHKPANLHMTYRFRVEQRFVEKLKFGKNGEIHSDGYKYGTRLRFFNRTIYDLTKNPEAKNVFYAALQDEVFLNVASPDINKNFFDQNRFLLAFGVFNDKRTRLELGYMNQFLNPYKIARVINHIVHVSVLQTLDFSSL